MFVLKKAAGGNKRGGRKRRPGWSGINGGQHHAAPPSDSCMAEGGSWSAGLSSSWSGSGLRGMGEEMWSIAVARRGVGRLMAAGVEEEPMIVDEENAQGGNAFYDGRAESLSDEMLMTGLGRLAGASSPDEVWRGMSAWLAACFGALLGAAKVGDGGGARGRSLLEEKALKGRRP